MQQTGLILTALGFVTGAAGAYWHGRWAIVVGASACLAGIAIVTLSGAIP
tara:strand:+ start:3916 stop:4065 length:150 start_codon:yes stop_codon:yes gene_type:complete